MKFPAPFHSVAGVIVREMVRAAPGPSMALGACGLVAGLIPVAYIVATAQVLGDLAQATAHAPVVAPRPLLVGCAIIALLFALQQILLPMTRVLGHRVGAALNVHLRDNTLDVSLGRIGLSHLEQPVPAGLVADAALAGGRTFDTVEMVLVLSDKLVARRVSARRRCWLVFTGGRRCCFGPRGRCCRRG